MARNRRRRRWPVVVPVAVLVALAGGYVAADAADLVPGVLTTRPEPAADPPYPVPVVPDPPELDAVTGPDDAAAAPDGESLADLTAALLADPAVASAGVLVADVVGGGDLDGVDAEVPRAPASTTKVLTATAAIASAGADHRFVTRVVDGTEGEIVLVAGGDLTLAAGAGDPDAVIGHAGLGDLAEATAAELIERGTTTVSVGLDVGYYAGPDMAPRWDDIDLGTGDAMHMAPIAIDIGRQDGARSRVVDPAGAAAEAFVSALVEAGITVQGDVTAATAAADAAELASVSSARLSDLVAYTLQHSENILSESLGRLVAHEVGEEPSFAGAGVAVREVLGDLGIDVAGLELHDTSGLSSTNRVSPRTLVDTLLAVAERPELGSVARGLPVAGLEGTLIERLEEPPAAGRVLAKTGTLRTVVSLSGYVTTADGRLLAFAVIATDVPSGAIAGVRDAVDEWVAAVASCGC